MNISELFDAEVDAVENTTRSAGVTAFPARANVTDAGRVSRVLARLLENDPDLADMPSDRAERLKGCVDLALLAETIETYGCLGFYQLYCETMEGSSDPCAFAAGRAQISEATSRIDEDNLLHEISLAAPEVDPRLLLLQIRNAASEALTNEPPPAPEELFEKIIKSGGFDHVAVAAPAEAEAAPAFESAA